MSTPDITFGVLDGTEAVAHADELQVLHAEVYTARARPGRRRRAVRGPLPGPAAPAGLRAGRGPSRRVPGRVRVGFPLRPSTSWWRHLTTALPEEVTAEHPGRTFALCELLVRAPWRRQGIGAALHDLILRDRPEERATLTVPPAATPAQAAFRAWGWRKVARTRDAGPGSSVCDVLVLTLPAAG